MYINFVEIEFDPAKRSATLVERGLDFENAVEVFKGHHFTRPDDRVDYGESRFITAGLLAGRWVVVVWTPRGKVRRIISMRKANERETQTLTKALGRS
jgi:uncharacterized protein